MSGRCASKATWSLRPSGLADPRSPNWSATCSRRSIRMPRYSPTFSPSTSRRHTSSMPRCLSRWPRAGAAPTAAGRAARSAWPAAVLAAGRPRRKCCRRQVAGAAAVCRLSQHSLLIREVATAHLPSVAALKSLRAMPAARPAQAVHRLRRSLVQRREARGARRQNRHAGRIGGGLRLQRARRPCEFRGPPETGIGGPDCRCCRACRKPPTRCARRRRR